MLIMSKANNCDRLGTGWHKYEYKFWENSLKMTHNKIAALIGMVPHPNTLSVLECFPWPSNWAVITDENESILTGFFPDQVNHDYPEMGSLKPLDEYTLSSAGLISVPHKQMGSCLF